MSPASARTRTLLIGWLVGAALVAAPTAVAGPAVDRAAAYLERAQHRDGGVGASVGGGSAPLTTISAALGLAAAGRDLGEVRRGRDGRSLLDAVVHDAAGAETTGDVARAMLALGAAGRPAGAALLEKLLADRRADGSFGGQVAWSSFAVLALRAAGRPTDDEAVAGSTAFVAAQQNPDGGFNFAVLGGRSGIDETAAALQALIAGGRPADDPAVRRGVAFLVAAQNRDGGLPLLPGGTSNAQSTAWAVQALVAAGRRPATVRSSRDRTPLRYLRSLQARDGSIRYSRTSVQTPVWVTAQALCALARAPFPIVP